MSSESEATLEKKLIESMVNNGYERVEINDKNDLELNFKKQLEKFNNTTNATTTTATMSTPRTIRQTMVESFMG